MPVQTCTLNGVPGYKNGANGTCHTYKMGDKASRDEAKSKAKDDNSPIMEVKKDQKTPRDLQMKIIKTDNSFNTVLFVALVPFETDRNGDIITNDEITNTAHDFVRNLNKKAVNVDHQDDTEIDTAEFVESFIAPVDIPVGLETIPQGAWVVGIKFDDDTYKAIVDGEFVGISIDGHGNREKITV